MSRSMRLHGRRIEISREDKILFPGDGITKGDLIEYYHEVAPLMVRHLRNRPLVMRRFPDGIAAEGFYQKNASDYFPGWIDRVTVEKEGGIVEHAVCSSPAALVYLADQACIELHVWLSTVNDIDRPDQLVLDLDPPGADLVPLRRAVREAGDMIAEVGLVPFLMTTGSRGYHVVAPLRQEATFDESHEFARDIARALVRRDELHLTIEQRKDERGDRVFVDYLRNSYAQTHVAPYSVRPLSGAPVATPIDWDELGRIAPGRYDLKAVLRRLQQKKDPWADILRHRRSLQGPRQALDAILEESGLRAAQGS